ncbi:MAG TPA: hypothetical protein VHO69_13500, partial [Phototrophicaceae bacterium]|nr:hypothetical protein [Phototrophicaceae bacterium]
MDGFVQPPEMQLPEVKGVGLTPGNPFAPLALGSLILLIVAVIGLFGLVIFGPDNSVRYTAATILLLVIILAPLPVTWLGIYSRNFVRIQRIIGGDYWAHWQLSPGENPHGDEVYIGPLGLYWPKRRWSLWGFGHGLVKVEK